MTLQQDFLMSQVRHCWSVVPGSHQKNHLLFLQILLLPWMPKPSAMAGFVCPQYLLKCCTAVWAILGNLSYDATQHILTIKTDQLQCSNRKKIKSHRIDGLPSNGISVSWFFIS